MSTRNNSAHSLCMKLRFCMPSEKSYFSNVYFLFRKRIQEFPRGTKKLLENPGNSTRAVNRQPGYRPGRLVEPFAFNRNRDRNNDIHIQKHRKPQAHTHTSGGRRQQNNRNATANQQKLRQNQQQKTITNPQQKTITSRSK